MHYFLRVNGKTRHNNPGVPGAYVPGEPPRFPKTRFNYLEFCFDRNIVRLGWPDTGDLQAPSKTGALANAYSLDTVKPHERTYLETYASIQVGSIILVPNKDRP